MTFDPDWKDREELAEENSDAILFTGFEEAYIGMVKQFGRPTVACYDYNKCVEVLVRRDGMTHEEAEEFLDYNTLSAGLGENTPAFLFPVRPKDNSIRFTSQPLPFTVDMSQAKWG